MLHRVIETHGLLGAVGVWPGKIPQIVDDPGDVLGASVQVLDKEGQCVPQFGIRQAPSCKAPACCMWVSRIGTTSSQVSASICVFIKTS